MKKTQIVKVVVLCFLGILVLMIPNNSHPRIANDQGFANLIVPLSPTTNAQFIDSIQLGIFWFLKNLNKMEKDLIHIIKKINNRHPNFFSISIEEKEQK
jgi:hypothetical protein